MDKEIAEITTEKPALDKTQNRDLSINHIQLDNPTRTRPIIKHLRLVIGGFVLVLALLTIFLGLPAYKIYSEGNLAYEKLQTLKTAVKDSDLSKTKVAISETRKSLVVIQNDLNNLSWVKFLPLIGSYISDAQHAAQAGNYGLEAAETLILTIEPYADILGFKGQVQPVPATAEDRIVKAIETLDKIAPQIDKTADKIVLIKKEIDQIEASRYPESFSGKPVRARLLELKEIVTLVNDVFTSARPMVKKLPELLGTKSEAKYMVLFQNDKELRPTGGFITAYAIFRIDKGRIFLDSADDIYKLDDTVTRHVAPPEPISKYLNVYGWRLRDANFSPDFATSMKVFQDIYATSNQKREIKGIMAVDTQFLTAIIDVLGPISVYGTAFTTEKVSACDCPMVIYELLKQAGTPRNYWTDNRKDMIGVLLQALMKKALDAPSEMNGKILRTGLQQVKEKHLLLYLNDPDAQKGLETLGFAGQIKSSGGDYLHISDANLGGAKSNLYIVQSIKQNTTITDTGAKTNLIIEYKYPRSADNCSLERKEGLCLAGIYRDYLRVYLPQGAKIDEVRGFENKSKTFDDLGHTVVDGFFTVVPQGLARIEVDYTINGNFKKQHEYKSLIQKQPGTNANHYKVTINNKVQEFDLVEDKELSVKL